MQRTFQARFYDSTSSEKKHVRIAISSDGALEILSAGEETPRCISAGEYDWELPVGRGPQLFRLRDGALIEADFDDELQALMLERKPGSLRRLWNAETNYKTAFALLGGACAVIICLHVYAVPLAATLLRPLVPIALKENVGTQGIKTLDKLVFNPTQVPATRQKEITAKAMQLAEDAQLPFALEVHFRRLGELPNAFALPPRHVVLTDGIVDILDDGELEAVLAHELGHLAHDHVTHMIIRGAIVSGVAFALFGGDPGVINSLVVGLIDAQYSQNHETEADTYGVSLFKRLDKQPALLADALEKLQATAGAESKLEGYFSSHPLTSQRVSAIRNAAAVPATELRP